MKTKLFAAFFLIACANTYAANAKPCEALKTEIAAKIDATKTKGYSLDIVESGKVGTAKVVGSCDKGTKKIIYVKQ